MRLWWIDIIDGHSSTREDGNRCLWRERWQVGRRALLKGCVDAQDRLDAGHTTNGPRKEQERIYGWREERCGIVCVNR